MSAEQFIKREKEIESAMRDAYLLSTAIGVIKFFKKNQKELRRMISIHLHNENIVYAETLYFIYGVHDKLKKILKKQYKGDLFSNPNFVEKIHMPAIGIIVDTPPKPFSTNEYADMICELLFAQNDEEFLGAFDKYNYEYPDRIKKMLSNDIDVLAETTFYSVAMTIQKAKVKYLNKGLISADFILYYYAIYRGVVFSCEIDEKQKSHFDRTLKKHFIEYCETKKMFKQKEETEMFFNSRYTKYSELIRFEDDKSTLDAMNELLSSVKKEFTMSNDSEADIIREIAELMELLRRETRNYFSRMLEEYERLSIVSTLDNAIDVVEKEIEYQKESD